MSHHFLEALLAMRPAKDMVISWELLTGLALVAHHPVITSGHAGRRAWHRIKHRLSVPVADIVAGTDLQLQSVEPPLVHYICLQNVFMYPNRPKQAL